jgi:hypothetical protein
MSVIYMEPNLESARRDSFLVHQVMKTEGVQ